MNYKSVGLLLIIFNLFLFFDVKKVFAMGLGARAKSLVQANSGRKKQILEDWHRDVARMNVEERKNVMAGIQFQINYFNDMLQRFRTDESFKETLLKINPQQERVLQAMVEAYESLRSPIDA